MSLLDIDRTKNELIAIFPQHNEATIRRICLEVVNNLGVNTHDLILPMCIEQLLELPGDNDNDNGMNPGPAINDIIVDDWGKFVPGLNHSDSSNDGYDSPSSDDDDDALKGNDDYRNKQRPVYRENTKEGSESPNKSPDYLSDKDDAIFADIDDLDLDGFVKAPTKSKVSTPTIITIKDSPLANRKRKMESNDSFNPIDLTGLTNDTNIDILNVKRPAKSPNSNINSTGFDVTPTNNTSKNNILQNGVNGMNGHHTPSSALCDFLLGREEHTPVKTNGLKNHHTPVSTISAKKEHTPIIKTEILTKGMTGYLERCKEQVKLIINDVDNTYLESLINLQSEITVPEVVQRIIGLLLDNKNYPKVTINKPGPSKPSSSTSTSTITSSSSNLFEYNQQAVNLLQNSFPKVSTKIIRKVFHEQKNYTKSFDIIENAHKLIVSGSKRVEETVILYFLKGSRPKIRMPNDLNETLSTEIKEMEKSKLDTIAKDDRVAAEALNNKQYDEEGQAIECGCCYCEVAFDDMIQCLEGHLFCTNCLQSYSKEAVYGSGKAQLFCMTDGCDSTFPMSQMKKALTGELLKKYMERVQDEDLKLANIDNLIKCPSCDFAAEMADGDKVFRCQNPSCLKETCRYCQEEWEGHFGIPCKELEKKEVTNLRTTYEEKMTKAKVRECWQCKTIFLKSEGCNKMTCRCGAKMCYICRKAKIDYAHFCQHPRNPGEGCKQCKKCNLWTDPSEDDDRAVAEIKKEAEEERLKVTAQDEEASKISIGPSISVTPSHKPHQRAAVLANGPRLPLLQRDEVARELNNLNPRLPLLQPLQRLDNFQHAVNNLQRINNMQYAFNRQFQNNGRYR